MKYSLKGLVQFKGFSHVLKFPFNEVGLGKAIKPWVTEELLNKIADDLIIKTQNMVIIAKGESNEYDVFLMDVRGSDFNENFRQNCLDLLSSLVKKHLNADNTDLNSVYYGDSLKSVEKSQTEISYKFFNPNTTINSIRSAFAGKDCDIWSRAQNLTKGIEEILLSLNVSKAFVVTINDVNIYSFNSEWVNKYNAKEFSLSALMDGLLHDLMGDSHDLGKYAIAWSFDGDVSGVEISLSLTNLVLFTNFPAVTNKLILESIYGIKYQRELEALGAKNLFASTLYQSYVKNGQDRAFLTAKDSLMSDAFSLYWERVKHDNFEGIDFEAIKSFFIENKKYSADSGVFLKVYIFQVMSALTLGNKEKNLELFDRCFNEIVPIFDRLYQKHLSLEFSKVIERGESANSLPFGIKFVENFSESELSSFEADLRIMSDESEVYVCKPLNADLSELFFFNGSWTDDLRARISQKFKKINVANLITTK